MTMTNNDPEDLKDQYLEETDAEEGNVESVVPSDRDVLGILNADGTFDEDGEDDDEDVLDEDGEDSIAARDDGLSNIGPGIPGNRDLPNADEIIDGEVVVDDLDDADEGVSIEAMAAEGLTVGELRDDEADAIVSATLDSETLTEADGRAEAVVLEDMAAGERTAMQAAPSRRKPAAKVVAVPKKAVPKKTASRAKAPAKAKSTGAITTRMMAAKPVAKSVGKVVAKPTAKTVSKPSRKATPKPTGKVVPNPSGRTTAKPMSKAFTKTMAIKPAIKTVSKVVAPKTTAKPAVTPVSKVAPKAAAKPAVKPMSKVAPKADAKPVVKPTSKAVPKPASKAVVKPTAKPAAKPASKAAPKPAAKTATKPASAPKAKPKTR